LVRPHLAGTLHDDLRKFSFIVDTDYVQCALRAESEETAELRTPRMIDCKYL